MRENSRLRIAIQKTGRLSEKSIALFKKCGLDFDVAKDRLFHQCNDFPIDLMLVRDDDIPEYVADGICDLGVVGENILQEKGRQENSVQLLTKLGFGHCRLSLAVPEAFEFRGPGDLNNRRIATSYPVSLRRYLDQLGVQAKIIELSGSVEIAPKVGIADAICDLVSTGGTLKSNGLKEVTILLESQAALIQTGIGNNKLGAQAVRDVERLLQRVNGVLKASQSKYIMMNAPQESLAKICRIIPGMEEPSVMPIGTDGKRVAIHAVAREAVFWETMEKLKELGASSILVLPIEKVIA